MFRAFVLFISFVLLAGYGAGNTIRENVDDVAAAEPISLETLDEVQNNNLQTASIIALQATGANPPRQCAGIGQACASHGDCCTSSCFGVLRTCIPNLGIALNIQIGRADKEV